MYTRTGLGTCRDYIQLYLYIYLCISIYSQFCIYIYKCDQLSQKTLYIYIYIYPSNDEEIVLTTTL